MIVIDPVLTDTAKLADFHLRVRPGTDAWCLAAMVAVLVQEDLVDREFLAAHVSGSEPVLEAFAEVDVPRYAEYCDVAEDLIRAASRRIASAESVSAFEDLGIQQAPNSTLCSYVNRLLWILTGNFGNPGGMHLHTSFVNLFRDPRIRRTPVPRQADRARAARAARRAPDDRRRTGDPHHRPVPDRPVRRRAPVVHGQRHLPQPRLVQAGHGRPRQGQRRGRDADGLGGRCPCRHHDGAR
jgi:anaerobic selenocysteine-containing dehydrogenase